MYLFEFHARTKGSNDFDTLVFESVLDLSSRTLKSRSDVIRCIDSEIERIERQFDTVVCFIRWRMLQSMEYGGLTANFLWHIYDENDFTADI